MKILLYGERGWIGGQVLRILETHTHDHEVVCGKARIDDTDALDAELISVNPSHVMCFVGRTHGKIGDKVYTTIDYLEQPNKLVENIADNLYGPVSLAILCTRYGIHLTYLGTGCIFEYDDMHPMEFTNSADQSGFTESDRPNFFGSSYSVVKGYTDRFMKLYESSVLNLRIRMPITADNSSRNFITKITTYSKICSVPNSMTVLPDLLPIAIDMAENRVVGTYNLTNPGTISHNEILEMYKEIVDKKFEWSNFSIEQQAKILAAARSNNYLDTSKLEALYHVKPIKEAVRDVLIRMKDERDANNERDTKAIQ
jgi:dTDP-4-dehydrorhamnose reductase